MSGTNKERSSTKTAAYTSYLLQSRPDMLMVQGIYVDEGGFKLTVSNACGASYTEYLDWGSLENCLLLCAWIWRLYEPFVDPSITANPEPDKPQIFTIEIHEDLYRCNIRRVGTTIGRRTIIFDGKAPNNAKPDIIIKEQYIETSRRFNEGAILEKAHREKKTFPGVVRAGWSGPVKSGEKDLIVQWKDPKTGEIYERKKTRVVLLDKGGPIMDAKTPREVLVAMYDLLESEPLHQRQDALLIMQQVTRFLHKKRKILHRDISASNVLLRDAATTDESLADDLQEMCFASHLLRDRFGDPKSALSSKVVASTHFHSANRLDTKVLLIDFDMGEDQDYNGQGGDKKGPHERTVRRYLIMRWSWLMRHRQGTPIFMARDVVSAEENQGVYFLFSMPQLDQGLKTYQAAVGDRLIDFPPNELEICKIDVNQPLKPFKHKLRYDAESVFWLLLWWAIHALPVEEAPFYNRKEIPQDIWVTLTSGNNEIDPRDRFVRAFPRKIVHPIYEPLEELLKDMAAQLDGYPEKSEVPSRRKDEYIHEAFQRLILEFLCKRCDERFMTAEKSDKFRQPEESAGMKGLLSTKYKEEKSGASSSSRPVDTPPSREPRQKRKISYTVASGSPEIGEDAKDEDFRPGVSTIARISILVFTLSTEKATQLAHSGPVPAFLFTILRSGDKVNISCFVILCIV